MLLLQAVETTTRSCAVWLNPLRVGLISPLCVTSRRRHGVGGGVENKDWGFPSGPWRWNNNRPCMCVCTCVKQHAWCLLFLQRCKTCGVFFTYQGSMSLQGSWKPVLLALSSSASSSHSSKMIFFNIWWFIYFFIFKLLLRSGFWHLSPANVPPWMVILQLC